MIAKVYHHDQARRDLIEHFVYLAENAGLAVAEQFLTNAESSFNTLSANPWMGSLLTLGNQELAGMRKWPIKGFDNFLIFYMPRHDGVSIVRVLHAAQDWWGLLGLVQ